MTPDASSGVTPSLDAADLVSAVPELNEIATVQSETVAALGSANITIKMIADLCEKAEASDADGFVVTQGTDTMEESAYVASLLYKGVKPIVFTGAMRAAMQPGADGPNNLYNSVLVAASKLAPKVSIVMNGEIHDPWHVAKEHTVALNAFMSEYAGPLGCIIEQKLQIRNAAVNVPPIKAPSGPLPAVALLSAGFDTDTCLLDGLEGLGYCGLVVEALGAGHVSEAWADALGKLAKRMPVLLSTRASGGPVLENSYGYKGAEIDLINRGLIPCGDLKGRKARLLLTVLLAVNPKNWREFFESALAEI